MSADFHPRPYFGSVIDSHQHVFWHGRDDVGLIEDMDKCGVERAWLLSWEIIPEENAPKFHRALNPEHMRPDGTHAGIPLADLVRARRRFPSRFVLGYCPHPLVGDASELLRAAAAVHRVRICGEWKFRVLFDDPRCLELFRTAGELGLPVVLHLDVPFLGGVYQNAWYGGTVDNLQRALQACPRTHFIGHAPGFWREISGDSANSGELYPEGPVAPGGRLEALLNAHENLSADLSAQSALTALRRDPEFSTRFLEKFSNRFLFARDYYENDLRGFLETLDLSADARKAIFHDNAERLVPSGSEENLKL